MPFFKTQLFTALLIVSLLSATNAFAFETDQYNLPHLPLADVGDEVTDHVEQQLLRAIEKVNREIATRSSCIKKISEKPKGCGSLAKETEKLTYLRSNRALADEFAELLAGDNLTTTKFGGWMYKHKFRGQPDRYKTSYGHSIYILSPANYATISPTVRLYGVEFGIDKLEHFFQQGYQYFEIERKALAKEATPEQALKKAISWGKKTERTYYGLLTSGVYSPADLAANYAGMRFYHRLTTAVRTGETTFAPLAVLADGYWKRNSGSPSDTLLKPFISDHFNEAFNPSAFRFTLVRSVRRTVRKYACEDWRKWHPDLTAEAMLETSKKLQLWHGEDYGWTKKSHTVSITKECLEDKSLAD
ncbi:MAG: hypothetical protein ACKVRN_05285 [Pyrinomonadaceae bacterium]